MRIPWVGTAATAKSSNVSNLLCTNLYAEVTESRQGKTAVALYPTPGLRHITTLTGNTIRAMYVTGNGRLFVVSGSHLHEVYANDTSDDVGTIHTESGRVAMSDNGLDVMLVDGAFGYTYTLSTGVLAQIVDVDFLGAFHIGLLDGYFVLLRPGSQQFYWSDLYSSAFSPLNLASAEGSPDLLVALLVAHREVWLFGRETTEVWYSTGQAGADAFARLEGALLEYGCGAAASPAIVGDTICWLAQNTQGQHLVVQAQGTGVQRISTHPLEETLATYSSVADARGYGYQQEGHTYYWLSFPSARATWVYDLTTGLWHQRSRWLATSLSPGPHLGYEHGFAHGRHYVGDLSSGNVYVLDDSMHTDAGQPIVREIISPPIHDPEGARRLKHTALQLDCETGVGLDGNPPVGVLPMVELSYSDDGGHLWSAPRNVSLGALGQYRTRVRVTRLGASRDRRYRIRMSSPCRWVILGATVDVEPLVS